MWVLYAKETKLIKPREQPMQKSLSVEYLVHLGFAASSEPDGGFHAYDEADDKLLFRLAPFLV